MNKTLKKIFWFSGLLLLSCAVLIAAALVGFYVGSGKNYKVDMDFFREYVQDKQPSITVEEIHKVSHEEAYAFVLLDKTNENEYREGYNCVDFALELWRNASWNHIECKLIGLDQRFGRSHMIVGFPDETGQLLLVDPRTDAVMHPIVGEHGFLSVYEVTFIGVPLEVE